MEIREEELDLVLIWKFVRNKVIISRHGGYFEEMEMESKL